MTKIAKIIGVLFIIGLGVYLIIQSLFIDVNKIHNFQNIKDFEKFHRPSEPLVILSCFNSFFSESILWFRSHHFFD